MITTVYVLGSRGVDFLDLNYLLHRQQVERARADNTENHAARAVHEELSKQYEERIEELTGDEFHFPKSE